MPSPTLSFADHAWLRMDRPSNLMIITGLMTFAAPLDFERLKTTIQGSLLNHPPFTQRLAKPWLPFLRAAWEDVPYFDLDDHLERVTLPLPADKLALQDFISAIQGIGLDHTRPLWRFYLIENYGKGSALVARLHHCIADGIALMNVLLSLTHTTPGADLAHPSADAAGHVRQALQRLNPPPEILAKSNHGIVRRLLTEGAGMLSDPARARAALRFGAKFTTAVGRLALRWPDPETPYKGPLGVDKRVAWSDPLDLEAVKRMGRAYAGTVNDVLLTIVAGALRRYLETHGSEDDIRQIRGIVPVNLRPVGPAGGLGNKFGLVFLSLPVEIVDPVERLHRLKHNMDELKTSTEALAAFGVLNVIGAIPHRLQNIAVSIFDAKGTAVMTNVPGPQHQLYLAGAPLEMLMAWVPQSGRIGLGVSILSYNHKVWVGFATDQHLVPDPEKIVASFYEEFGGMQARAEKVLTKRSASVQPLIAMLDEALTTLDEIQSNGQKTLPAQSKPKRKTKKTGS